MGEKTPLLCYVSIGCLGVFQPERETYICQYSACWAEDSCPVQVVYSCLGEQVAYNGRKMGTTVRHGAYGFGVHAELS